MANRGNWQHVGAPGGLHEAQPVPLDRFQMGAPGDERDLATGLEEAEPPTTPPIAPEAPSTAYLNCPSRTLRLCR